MIEMEIFGIDLIFVPVIIFVLICIYMTIKIVRPTERAVIERFGKYNRFAEPGLVLIIPFVEDIIRVNITERMVDAESQEIITKDNLNAKVDAQVYFKVKQDESNVKNCQYNVDDYETQIVALARTTMRNIIGQMQFKEVNSQRAELNLRLAEQMEIETKTWGISVVRTELKEIIPPQDVQDTMNKVIKAENEKTAATDFATAVETQADGKKRAAIKEAEGIAKAIELKATAEKQATILRAEGDAKQIELVNESARTHFKDQAVELKKLETLQKTFKKNTKIVVSSDQPIMELFSKIGQLKEEKGKGK